MRHSQPSIPSPQARGAKTMRAMVIGSVDQYPRHLLRTPPTGLGCRCRLRTPVRSRAWTRRVALEPVRGEPTQRVTHLTYGVRQRYLPRPRRDHGGPTRDLAAAAATSPRASSWFRQARRATIFPSCTVSTWKFKSPVWRARMASIPGERVTTRTRALRWRRPPRARLAASIRRLAPSSTQAGHGHGTPPARGWGRSGRGRPHQVFGHKAQDSCGVARSEPRVGPTGDPLRILDHCFLPLFRAPHERAPRAASSHSIRLERCVPRPQAASSGVPCEYSGTQPRSPPRLSRRSAARR